MRCVLALLLLLARLPAADPVYVRQGARGTGDGSSWADAYTDIALAAISTSNDRPIWVAQGTYVIDQESPIPVIDRGLYGGFIGNETSREQRPGDPGLTVLSGWQPGGYRMQWSIVSLEGAHASVDMLTIVGGASFNFVQNGFLARGVIDAIAVESTLTNVRLVDNYGTLLNAHGAVEPVGGLITGRLMLRNCVFSGNHVDASQLTSPVLAVNCANLLMSGCIFSGNQTHPDGIDPNRAMLQFATVTGRVENCVFAGNGGSAIGWTGSGALRVVACTVAGERYEYDPAGAIPATHDVLSSITQVRPYLLSGRNWLADRDGDPLFLAAGIPAGADGIWFTADDGFHLRSDSPCLDWGRMAGASADEAVPAIDITGVARPQNRDPEPGAYEFFTGNSAPVASDRVLVAREDAPLAITLAGSDADGQTIVYRIASLPVGGRLGLDAAGSQVLAVGDAVPGAILYFIPAADDNGPGRGTFTVIADDGLSQSYPATVVIDVSPVNDAPTLDPIADVVIGEDAGSVQVPLTGLSPGATGIVAGGAGDERAQVLTVSAHSSQPFLIPDPAVLRDTVSGEWRLSFAPLADANGSATISVTVRDSGGTADGGVDAVTRMFTVRVEARNDAPRIDPIPNQTMNEDEGMRRVLLTGIRCGPITATDENAQHLTLAVVSGFPSGQVDLVVFQEWQAADGSLPAELWIWPQADVYGSHQVWVVVSDDGGTANGGIDGAVTTFWLTIRPRPDAPVLTANDPVPVGAGDSPVTNPQSRDADGTGNFFRILSLPQRGQLLYHASAVAVGDGLYISGSNLIYRRTATDGVDDAFDVALADADGAFPDQGPLTVHLIMPGPQAPVVATTWVGTVQGVVRRLALVADDADSAVLHWTLLSQPTGAALALADDGMLTITPVAGAIGESPFQVQVTDGVTAPVTASIALRITGLDAPRPHVAGEAPLFVVAGADLDVTVPFTAADLGGSAALSFALAGDPPAGLTVEAVDALNARLRWAVPAAQPAGWYEILVLAVDDGGAQPSRTVGCWPLRLGVLPAPAGRN